jgi:UDP-glucose 4-epimerase
VYGIPDVVPVDEAAQTRPINPYGATKLMVEHILADAKSASGLNYVALRYFNVAGADPSGRCGQVIENATNLTKVVCEVVTGKRSSMYINGTDYDTPDGTCVRDYIHVSDLASAHVNALAYLGGGGDSQIVNVGYGKGYSVLEVIKAMERHIHSELHTELGPRRPGDPPSVIASNAKAIQLLDWSPKYNDLDLILKSALAWERRQFN